MKSSKAIAAILFFPALLVSAGLPVLSLENLASQSDVIVSGRVVRSWAALDPENRFIWTHYEIKVTNILKGPAQASIEIAEPGGALHGVTQIIPGSTSYAAGEQVSIFLYRTPIGYLRTTNYGQGKFLISPDGRVVPNHWINIAGASIADGHPSPGGTKPETLEGMNWKEFELRVSRIVADQREVR